MHTDDRPVDLAPGRHRPPARGRRQRRWLPIAGARASCSSPVGSSSPSSSARRSTTTATSTRSVTRAAARPAAGCASRARSTRVASASTAASPTSHLVQRREHAGALQRRAGRHVPGVHPGGRPRQVARATACSRATGRGQALQRVRRRQRRPAGGSAHDRATACEGGVSDVMLAASLNGALGNAGLMLVARGVAASARSSTGLAIVTGNRGSLRQAPRYAWLCARRCGAQPCWSMQRALITRDFSLAYVQQVGSRDDAGAVQLHRAVERARGQHPAVGADPRRLHGGGRAGAFRQRARRPARRRGRWW